jgi:leucyl-tRNA synthetase
VLFNSGAFDGLSSAQAFDRIAEHLSSQGVAQRQTHYRLRDWGVSRQRYWGTPIPMIYCQQCGTMPVPETDLPVILPTNIQMDDSGRSPLHTDASFFQVNCPTCQQPAKRETDTFDTFMESSWYYARFTAAREQNAMLTPAANDWLAVDHYVGGIEHAVLHLLYARFFHKLMRDMGLVNSDEPFKRLLCQGMVVSDTFYRTDAEGKRTYFYPHEVTLTRDDKGRPLQAQLISDGLPLHMGGIEKMSKSKNNGVDPQQLIDRYGADTVRLFILFAAPPDQSLEWSEAGVEGAHRFLKRLWRQVQSHQQQLQLHQYTALPTPAEAATTNELKDLRRKIHSTLQKATDELGRRLTFNTAIAGVMELFNALQKLEGTDANTCAIRQECLETMVLILAPITPHIGHVLWQQLGWHAPLHQTSWRSVDTQALLTDSINWAIQINGKLRGQLTTALQITEADLITQAQALPSVAKFLENQTVIKTIVVANKLVNLVVRAS